MQLTSRSRIGSAIGIIGALAISCQGSSGCVTQPGTPPDPPVLLTRYVLVRVQPPRGNPVAIPAVYDDSAGFQLRADADTLFFNADSTYREVGQTALVALSGSVTVRPQATGTPAPRYSVPFTYSITLPRVMGRVGSVSYYGQQLSITTSAGSVAYGGPYFYYEAR